MTPAGLAQLKEDEGFRGFVYDDRTGKPIKTAPSSPASRPTAGYGRNLADQGITEAEASFLLENDLTAIYVKLDLRIPKFATFPAVWQDVLQMIDYNTGNALIWTSTIAAMTAGDANKAVNAIILSKAASELPARYQRMAAAVLANHW